MKKAIIIGHTGQDGTYLYQLLKAKNYKVIGLSSTFAVSTHTKNQLTHNILDPLVVAHFVQEEQADEIYYLAAVHQSSSDTHLEEGLLFRKSLEVNVSALINFLEAIRMHSTSTKIFYAASSHVFGNPETKIQNEDTPFAPDCVYGITKTAGIQACRYYRSQHGLFASVGIFYNHESPLRPSRFVSRKIVETAVAIKQKRKNQLVLGNLKAKIDWGYAPDYMEAAWSMMQLNTPGEFIISSGEVHTVLDFAQGVFDCLGLDWTQYIVEDPSLITKKPKDNLFGDNHKITSATGWLPKVNFKQLMQLMVNAELEKYASK